MNGIKSRFFKAIITGLIVSLFVPMIATIFLVGESLGGALGENSSIVSSLAFDTTYAQLQSGIPPLEDENTENADLIQTLETVTKGIYLLMWPSLAVAGASLDNTLVYGKIFYLDTTLWRFWNIMRTFANFALGFIVIVGVLMAFYKQLTDPQRLLKLIKKLLIAGLLINLSRGVVATLIDFSTIGVASIGGLPLYVMDGVREVDESILFLKSHSLLDIAPTNDKNADEVAHSIIFSCAGNSPTKQKNKKSQKYYLPCLINNSRLVPKVPESEKNTRDGYKIMTINAWKGLEKTGGINVNENTIYDDFCVYGNELIQNTYGASIAVCSGLQTLRENGRTQMETDECSTLSDSLLDATGSTGPLYALYGSVFHMSKIAFTTNTGNTAEILIEMGMKTLVGLGLIIPLIALAVVLVVRVVVLRVIIAFSPVLLLAYTFEFKPLEDAQEGKLKMGTLISLIFLPVFATFALSMSLVFLGLIGNINMMEANNAIQAGTSKQPDGCYNDTLTTVSLNGIKRTSTGPEGTCYEFLGIQTLCISEKERTTGANIVNVLPWAVLNFFGITLMWTVVFMVLKSNKITGKIAGSIESFAKQGLSSIPIIPMVGGGAIGVGAAKQALDPSKISNHLRSVQQKQLENSGITARLDDMGNNMNGTKQQVVNQVINDPASILKSIEGTSGSSAAMFDEAIPKVVEKANSSSGPQGQRYAIPSSVSSARELLGNSEFMNYYQQSNQDLGDKGRLLNRIDKSRSGNRSTYSSAFAAGLRGITNASSGDGVNSIQTSPDQNGAYTEFVYANNRWTKLPWIKNGNREEIQYDAVDELAMSETGINTSNDVDSFISIVDTFGGVENLPGEFINKYWNEGGVNSLNELTRGMNSDTNFTVQVNDAGTPVDISLNLKINNGKRILSRNI